MKCAATKRDGAPCSGKRLEGSEFCSFHDPAKAQLFQLGRRVGGNKEKKQGANKENKDAAGPNVPYSLPQPPGGAPFGVGSQDKPELLALDTLADVIAFAADAANRVRSGVFDPKQGTAIGSLLNVVLACFKAKTEGAEKEGERPMADMTPERLKELDALSRDESASTEH